MKTLGVLVWTVDLNASKRMRFQTKTDEALVSNSLLQLSHTASSLVKSQKS